jgi:hypothetical protein
VLELIICSMGGGFSSTAWLPRVLLEQYPKEQLHFVTAVLPNEHPSMWRLYDAVEKALDIHVTYIAYDKENKWQYVDRQNRDNKEILWTPFDIFDAQKFIGNSRNDPCSHFLKRQTLLDYVNKKFGPEQAVMAVGIHDDEIERRAAIQENWKSKGYEIIFPLVGLPVRSREEQQQLLQEWYNVQLDLYQLGFEHNNCHGACVKAGQRQWALLWYYYPEIYQEWEDRENEWRLENGDYTILKKKIKGETVYITLKEFRVLFLEPALSVDKDTFLTRYIKELSTNPPCYFCSAI